MHFKRGDVILEHIIGSPRDNWFLHVVLDTHRVYYANDLDILDSGGNVTTCNSMNAIHAACDLADACCVDCRKKLMQWE